MNVYWTKRYWPLLRQALAVALPGVFMLIISLIGVQLSSDVLNNQEQIRDRQQQLLNIVDASRGAQLFFKNQQEAWRNLQDSSDNKFQFSHYLREYHTAENLVKRQLTILFSALTASELETDQTEKIIDQHDRLSEANDAALELFDLETPAPWLQAAEDGHGVEQQLSNRFGTLIGSVVVQATAKIKTQNEQGHARWERTQQLLFWITAVGVGFTSSIAWLNQRANKKVAQTLATLQHAKNELVRSEKLAALGALVAGVSHELNTPIGNSVTITSSLERWIDDIDRLATSGTIKRSDLAEFCEQAKEGCQLLSNSLIRANEIVSNFKQVAVDQSSGRRRQFELKTLVDEIIGTLGHKFKHTPFQLVSDIQPGIQMNGHPGALIQVLNNLILNALKHGLADQKTGQVTVEAHSLGSDRVQITISDNGEGIPKHIADKIFDPFFSTKMGEGGSGLGLYIVHNISTGVLEGSLWLDSHRSENGATFVMDIPRETSADANETPGTHAIENR